MASSVVLVDDHSVFREAFAALLASSSDFSVAGQSGEADSTDEMVDALKPDLVVMDVNLPGADGITATQRLMTRFPALKVFMLSAHSGDEYVARALSAGARGYALKSEPASAVLNGLRTVARGERYLAPTLPPSLVPDSRARRRRPFGSKLESLSKRERSIFDLVVRGFSNANIAQELTITIKTVETHRANINRKLDVHSSVQLLRFAAVRGLVMD